MHSVARLRSDRAALRSANALIGPDAAGTLPPDAEPPTVLDQLQLIAARIHAARKAAIADVGNWLIEAKKLLNHGEFKNWVDVEFRMTIRSAENYMQAARFLEGKCETVSLLPPTIIYSLAAPTAPQHVVRELIEQTEAGKKPDAQLIKLKLEAAKQAARRNDARRAKRKNRGPVQQAKQDEPERQERERERRQAEADEAVEELVRLLHDKVGSDTRLVCLLDTIEAGSPLFSLHNLADRLRQRGAA